MKRLGGSLTIVITLLAASGCTPSGMDDPADANTTGENSNASANDNEAANANAGSNGNTGGNVEAPLVLNSVTPDAINDQLYLSGEFGDTEGEVTLGGIYLSIISWGPAAPLPQQIVCELPRDAFGDVQVQSGARVSNVAQLTRWDLHLTSTTTITDPSATGQITIIIDVELIIRACINELLPHTGTGFGVPAAVSRDSTATITASGTLTDLFPPPGYQSSSLSASTIPTQDFKVVYPGDVVDPEVDLFTLGDFVSYANRDDVEGGGFKLLFSVAGYFEETQQLDTDVFQSQEFTGFATNTFLDTSLPIQFDWSSAFDIVSGHATAIADPNTVLEWQTAAAQAPPVDE